MATHFLGKKIGYVLTRFIQPITDAQFEPIADMGLPVGWVAWHIEDDEDIDNSDRVESLAERPIAVVLPNGSLGNYKTHPGRDIVEIPFPAAKWGEWLNRELEERQTKFKMVYCSQCGKGFGPGDHGFSHCDSHKGMSVLED